jgi:hypothetical protein
MRAISTRILNELVSLRLPTYPGSGAGDGYRTQAGQLIFHYLSISYGRRDYEPEPGLADNGDLEHDLQALFEQVGLAAKAAETALAIFIDELQYVEEPQLAVLITAMHRTEQRRLPVVLVGAGLPQLRGQMGNAKSYAERLFDFPTVGALPLPQDGRSKSRCQARA